MDTSGWVLPATASADSPRYAVALNGLLYRVEEVGPPADVGADVAAALRADREQREEQAVSSGGTPFRRDLQRQPETASVAVEGLFPLRVALLLRAGRADLAARFWNTWKTGVVVDATDANAVHLRDPYLLFATDWAWSLLDRAMGGHVRGDPVLTLQDAETLVRLAPAIEAEARRRGFEIPARVPPIYPPFLEPLDQLRGDAARRVREQGCARRAPPTAQSLWAGSVPELVRALDQVRAQPYLAGDVIVQALIAAGEPAVEPLLDVLARDTRLTRSVHFHRGFALRGVHEAAYLALSEIMGASFSREGSPSYNLAALGLEGRRAVAEEIRAFWRRWRGTPLPERWLAILSDDRAEPRRWLEAASSIVTPTNVTVHPGSTLFTTTMTTSLAPGERPRLRGEMLRSRTRPSLSALLTRRIDALLGQPVLAAPAEPLRGACGLAIALARWEARGNVAVFARVAAHVAKHARQQEAGLDIGLARCLRSLALTRAERGDSAAVPQFAEWIAGMTPTELPGTLPDMLEPLWRHPDDPAVERAVDTMFGRSGTEWAPTARAHTRWAVWELASTPLVRVPGFRRFLDVALADRRAVGELRIDDPRGYEIRIGSGSTSRGAPPGDRVPPRGTRMRLRVCDVAAAFLAGRVGAPAFAPYWPQSRREGAIRALAAYLEQEGTARTPLPDPEE